MRSALNLSGRTMTGPERASRPFWRIAEPATTLTDLALAALAGALAVPLLREGAARGAGGVLLWGAAFVGTAAAALLGAAVHGLAPWLTPRAKAGLWRATLVAVGLGNSLLLAGAGVAVLEGKEQALLLGLVGAKLLAYLARVARSDDFSVAALDAGVSLLGVLAVQAYAWAAGAAPGAPWIVGGVLVSVAGAALQQRRVGLHRHLNHNDLFHLFQMAAAYLLYRGGMAM